MLQKLRTRHPIDVPAEGFGRRSSFLAILGVLAVLFVLLPLVLSLAGGLYNDGRVNRAAAIAVGAGLAALLLAILVGAIRGKPGHKR